MATTDRQRLLSFLGPNWFASVMGTGIVATAGATLPLHVPGLRAFTQAVWVATTVWLVILIVAVAAHWMRNPTVARSHAYNPQMGHFYGAAPMALLTVGAGAVLVGKDLIGERAAVDLDWVLWTAGTLGGLFTAISIPYLMFTQYRVEPDAAFGGWLMPVVPPMVSAATGALLIPHMAAGTGRTTMLYGCYAMFGLSLVASLNIIAMIWVAFICVLFILPTTDTAVWWNSNFDYKTANYAPIVFLIVIVAVAIWWITSARHWFKGPIRNIDDEIADPMAPDKPLAEPPPTPA